MAARGRKTKTAQTTRRTPLAPGLAERWACPDHLTGEAAKAWNHVVGLLAEAGNLGRTDPTLVESYAMTRATLRMTHAELERDGLTVVNRAGTKVPHPAGTMFISASFRIKAIINDLGLSPVTSKFASTTGTASSGDEKGGKWDDMLTVVG